MSLRMNWNTEIPGDTARVGREILSENDPYRLVGDRVNDFLKWEDFVSLYSRLGRSGICPIILSLVTVFQFLENVPDRTAAKWAIARIDWKYALHLPLTWLGFDFSDLSNFRKRLLEHGVERLVFEKVLDWVRSLGLVKKHGKQRSDSTHIVGCVERLSRLELAWATLRQVWEQQFARQEETKKITVRQPPIKGRDVIQSPHDPEARWSKKREKDWVGYKLQVTETAEDDVEVQFITDIDVVAANEDDSEVVDDIQERLNERDLKPDEHYVDKGYVSGPNLAHSAERDIELVGPALADTSRKPERYKQGDLDRFREAASHLSGRENLREVVRASAAGRACGSRSSVRGTV